MKPVASYCDRAQEMGVDEAKIIDPRSVVTAAWVRMKCQYGCSGFGMGLCCPPHSPPPDFTRKVLDSYVKAILLHRKLERGERGKGFNRTVVRLEREMFLEGYYKAWSLGAGPCRLCKECDLKGCRHGDEARPSMEACGIDVFKTVRDNGFSIDVLRTREESRSSFGLILAE